MSWNDILMSENLPGTIRCPDPAILLDLLDTKEYIFDVDDMEYYFQQESPIPVSMDFKEYHPIQGRYWN